MLNEASNSAVIAPDRPLAMRMAVIAGFSHNLTVGCLFGSFSVLMTSVEQRFGVSRELSSLGVALVSVSNGILAPVVGALAARYSLRLLFIVGAILSIVGYALLATTQSYPIYLTAYGLFLGTGLTLSGVVLPSTLVTRWFDASRGQVLGMVHVPIFIALVPLLTTALLTRFGAAFTYAAFGVVVALILLPLASMVIDYPNNVATRSLPTQSQAPVPSDAATVPQILRSPRFWALASGAAMVMTGAVVLNTHMIPITTQWGISPTAGATLVSVCALAGIPGSIMWGWVADKIGGGPALALAAVNCALLWAVLLTNPSYQVALPVMALMGLHGAAGIPLVGTALSEAFGPASFSRAFGLSTMITLPFTVIGIQAASATYVKTGNYTAVLIAMIAAFLLIAPWSYLARAKRA